MLMLDIVDYNNGLILGMASALVISLFFGFLFRSRDLPSAPRVSEPKDHEDDGESN